MNPLQAFMVGMYVFVGLSLIAIGAILPLPTQLALGIGAVACLWRAHYWYENA